MTSLSSTSIAVISLICSYVALLMFSETWVRSVTGYELGNRRRVIAVLKIEVIITLLNIFVHRQLSKYFDHDDLMSKTDRRRNAQIRDRCSIVLTVILFLSQFMYFMYYSPGWLQWLLFDITTLCCGVWTNLIFFVCGFYLANLLLKPLNAFGPTRWLIDVVSQIGYLHALMFDRKTQIRFSLYATLILSFLMWFGCDYVVVKERTIPIKNFSGSSASLRLAVVSDIHAGASVYRHQVEMVVDRLMSLDVDAVAIVGDMVDGTRKDLQDRVEPFRQVAHHFPTYFVTGNHDYYYGDVMEWIDMYKKQGIHVLENNHTMLSGVCLAGVNDISSGKTGVPGHHLNVSAAFRGCPQSASRVLLSHNPAAVKEIPTKDLQTIDLMLSGHTHAGQFYVVIPLVYWMLPYYYGMYDLPNAHGKLMVSAGTLYQGPNMKMLGMSEIWLLNLVKE